MKNILTGQTEYEVIIIPDDAFESIRSMYPKKVAIPESVAIRMGWTLDAPKPEGRSCETCGSEWACNDHGCEISPDKYYWIPRPGNCGGCIHVGEWDSECVNCVRVKDRKDNWTPVASGEGDTHE
jgi:hypothetical protein